MINVKELICSILNDSRLTSIVEDILDAYPNSIEVFPTVIFLDTNQSDTEFADNKAWADICDVTVHIFTKAIENYPTTSQIGMVVDEIMKENYFTTTSNMEVADPIDDVRHRVINFRKILLF